MSLKNKLTIKEFARLTGIKRDNLRYYDRIGLLSPEMRGDQNNYRYYSKYQVNTAYLITSLRGLGVSIESIKKHVACLTPESTLTLFEEQDAHIQAEIQQLQETRQLLRMYADMLQEVMDHGKEALFIEEKASDEPIFLCPMIPDDMDGDEALIIAYDYAKENGINLGFPCGMKVPKKKMGTPGVETGGSGYFKLDAQTAARANAYKPAGLYAVVYGKCDIWKIEPLYERLLDFIKKEGMVVTGDAYEEYPMGVSMSELDEGCTRIEVPVTPLD